MTIDERIKARITELEQALEQTIGQANAIRGALAELRALLVPDAPIMSRSYTDDEAHTQNGVGAITKG